MKKEYFCDVYVARIPEENVVYETLYPESRDKEVSAVRNERVRCEKYFVWRLLEDALKKSLGVDLKDLKIEKNANGKWRADGIELSLTHAKNAVAVAISSSSVGVDLEPISALKNDISKRILTEREMAEYKALPFESREEYLIKAWTAKEAVFKASDESAFHPEKLEVSGHFVIWRDIFVSGERYLLSVVSEISCEPKLFCDGLE